MNIGVIGTGNMGGMLAKAFSTHRDVTVRVINRTASKARHLHEENPVIKIASSLDELVEQSDLILICTKSADGLKLFEEIGPKLACTQILATTISSLPFERMESLTPALVAKVIPSITQTANSGILLISYGSRFEDDDQDGFERLLSRISVPFVVQESQLRVASDLASCGPAFVSVLLSKWADAATNTGKVSHGEAEFILSQMIVGLADLLKEGLTLSDVITKVSVPGGVTETGVASLNRNTKDLFVRLHEATQSHKRSSKLVKFTTA